MEITPETLEHGLNGLDLFSQEPSSPTKSQDSHMMLSSSSSSLIIGDYIGMESCVDVLNDGDEYYDHHCPEAVDQCDLFRGKPDQRLEMKMKKKKKKKKASFPPPIPLLARTENLPCRMPWVLKRHYTSDGRLILTEEKVRHHEYFRAHRSNGRLTLQLVPLGDDDVVSGDDTPLVDGVDEDDSNNHADCSNNEEVDDDGEVNIDGCDGLDYDEEEEEELERNENRIGFEEAEAKNGNNSTSIEGMGEGKRLNYGSSVRSAGGSCCIFGMAAVPAIKTVHS
ncbi:The fantastic four family [Parasponia andersonii]|uniref:The fantastic four family n=1 Tax=Parasponia andersonii TaxID=3476 RepID=A0A2P5CR10_PARAD|nr:The fantastic four family [Parasponia andersonii]